MSALVRVHQVFRMAPFLVVLAIILYAGLRPEPVPQLFNQQDKLHHLFGFAALTASLRLAFPRAHMGWLVVFSLAAALLVEYGQGMLPHRSSSSADMLANALGVLLGWGFSRVMQLLWHRCYRDTQAFLRRR